MKIVRCEGNRNGVTDSREVVDVGAQCDGGAGACTPVGINRRIRNFDTLRPHAQRAQPFHPGRSGRSRPQRRACQAL